MARYDADGYNSRGRRQILGYSRLAQGGADQARARAEQRLAMARDPSLAATMARSRRVAEAKAEGSFDSIRDTYNQNGQNPYQMDESGNIGKGVNVGAGADRKYSGGPPKPKPARAEPMSYVRPAGQKIAETVAMTEPAGLMDMARKARRRNTLVIR